MNRACRFGVSRELRPRPLVVAAAVAAIAAAALSTSAARAAIVKVNDRKFPVGVFCPLESRAVAGADLSFVAGGPAARFTFSVENLVGFCAADGAPCGDDADCPAGGACERACSDSFGPCDDDGDCPAGERCGAWARLLLDNVTVVPQATFAGALLQPSPGYEDCYFETAPPGQGSGGVPGAPSYDHVAAGPERYLELFDAAASVDGWSGDVEYRESISAPRNPAGPGFPELDTSGGSLGVGRVEDGHGPVSASLLVTGLTPGQTYAIFGWWSIAHADRMTLVVEENACVDGDGDGFVICGGCVPAAGEVCGDCDDANPGCTADCTDADGDGLCPPADCDDAAATCADDCADADGDGIPSCRDGCEDPDGDGYGLPGGGTPSCAGVDCLEGNPYCSASCVDGDADGACPPADCDDADSLRRPGAPEINDCADQQCPGDIGYGVSDETSGNSGFLDADVDRYSWPFQPGATLYQAARASDPAFSEDCTLFATSSTLWDDPTAPAPGAALYYLNRPLAPCAGSWGQDGAGVERTVCPGAVEPDVFTFVDGAGDDIATTAFRDFLQPLSPAATDWFYFEIDEAGWNRNVAWCAENAAFYRTTYLDNAFGAAAVMSGTWARWTRAPSAGSAWQGPFTTPLVNEYGDFSFGEGTWCSEQFATEPRNCLFPNRTNDCEAYDNATGACANAAGLPWTVTIRIAPTRLAACGF